MRDGTLYRKKWRPAELFGLAAIHGAAYLSVFLLLGMMGYVFFRGFRVLSIRFLTCAMSVWHGTVGIAGSLLNTLYIIVLTLAIAVPVGVGAALYLSEYAKPGRIVGFIEVATETLAGIPSVIFGLFGMAFFGGVLGMGYSLLNGALTLSLMVLPLVVRNTQAALEAVPESYRWGALGLGAGKWHLIRTILLPSAMPGILTGILLAMGRIVGESAALLFTAGSARLLPRLGGDLGGSLAALYDKIFESGGTLSVELYLQMQNGGYETAFGIGCVLILLLLLTNGLMKLICGWIGPFPKRQKDMRKGMAEKGIEMAGSDIGVGAG